jgi:hypothetical protein
MYEAVECFWVEPDGKALHTLRRYRRGDSHDCPEGDYHYSIVEVGEHDVRWADGDDGGHYIAAIDVAEYAGDPRWPTHCACGYEFTEDDHWQVNQEPIYVAEDGRRAWTSHAYHRKPTPGAMFDTFWRPELRKEDGLAISVVCPDGAVWCIDDEATSGGHWTRTGTAPKLTVQPSIQTPDYHGHLTDGVLTAG